MNLDIRELQLVQLEMLAKLNAFFIDNNISYFLAYGSCLGAVRHSGFIPWDDDIDLIIDNDNYKKLLSIRHKLPKEFFFQDFLTDPEFGLSISRIRLNKSTLIEEDFINKDINHGVFIDIYRLYPCPENKLKYLFLLFFAQLNRLYLFGQPSKKRGFLTNNISKILLVISPTFLRLKFINWFNNFSINLPDSNYYLTLYGNDFFAKYDKKLFSRQKLVDFEGQKFPIPVGYDEYLKIRYGNYHSLPPKAEQTWHHDFVFFDKNTDFKQYKGKYYLKKP